MPTRCSMCNKKIGLITFKCSCCEQEYCTMHRLPEEHRCQGDYKAMALDSLKKKVMNESIQESHNYIKL